MDQFALLPAEERATIFREAAARLKLSAATIVEKDFWVCWTLQRIFSNPALPGPLFKGGTSLSKAYKVIERFSEDVDIVLDRHALGFTGKQDPLNIVGTNKRNRKLDELADKCSEIVQGTVRDALQNSFRSVLGEGGWKISEDPADADQQSLLFAYPPGLEADLYGLGTYIRPVVRLEFGCRGDVWPSERQPIRPYIVMCSATYWRSRPQKSTFFAPNAPFGKRPRSSTQSSILARCRLGSPGTTTTLPVCIATSMGSLR